MFRRIGIAVLVLGLLGGTTAAFGLTQALKLERSPVTAPRFDERFSPVCECETATATLSLRLRKVTSLDATIIDADGEPVRALVRSSRPDEGRVTFEWDGRDDAGAVVSDGPYRLRLHFHEQRRTIVIPNEVVVDTKAPRAQLVNVPRTVLSPDGDGRRDRIAVVYRTSERAHGLLFVGGDRAVLARARTGRAVLTWGGGVGERELAAGTYALTLRARDLAGNLSAPTEPVRVKILGTEIVKAAVEARRGGTLRFRVRTDALPFRWEIEQAGRTVLSGRSASNVVVAELPRRLEPGTYFLRVEGRAGDDRALVRVRPAR